MEDYETLGMEDGRKFIRKSPYKSLTLAMCSRQRVMLVLCFRVGFPKILFISPVLSVANFHIASTSNIPSSSSCTSYLPFSGITLLLISILLQLEQKLLWQSTIQIICKGEVSAETESGHSLIPIPAPPHLYLTMVIHGCQGL